MNNLCDNCKIFNECNHPLKNKKIIYCYAYSILKINKVYLDSIKNKKILPCNKPLLRPYEYAYDQEFILKQEI
jgi:hypothetical protein